MTVPGPRPGPGRGLLAVHAHPDDETLATGGLLATWAAAGLPVTVVTCTRGEQGEVIPPDLAHLEGDGPALATHRTGELARATSALGVRDHVFLDDARQQPAAGGAPDEPGRRFVDSGMAWVEAGRAGAAPDRPPGAFVDVDVEDAASRLATVLRDRSPQVVVGYEPGGGYGHPDHVHAHRVLTRAVELVAPDLTPAVLWSVVDQDALVRGRRALGPAPTGTFPAPAEDGLPSAAVPADLVDLRVDLVPVLDRVRAALRAHASQVRLLDEPPGPGAATGPDADPTARTAPEAAPAGAVEVLGAFTLSNAVVQPLLRYECYRHAPSRSHPHVAWPAGVAVRVP